MMEAIVFVVIAIIISGIFFAGWFLGGAKTESAIKQKSLEEINANINKMSKDFKNVDHLVDNAKSIFARMRANRQNIKISTPRNAENRSGAKKEP